MSAESSASLPIIDLSSWLELAPYTNGSRGASVPVGLRQLNYKTPSTAQLQSSQALHEACRERGFFYLVNTSCEDQMQEILHLAKQFFARPQGEKDALSITNSDRARGYQKLGENVTQYKADHHEGLDLYRPVATEQEDKSRPLHGLNQWPSQPAAFRAQYQAWIDKLQWLGRIVMGAAALGLNMDSYEAEALLESVDRSFWVLRAISYPKLPSDAEGISCGAHKDYGAWTFLLTDETLGALQVWHAASKTWLYADPIPGAFVVNIGEMWEIWTNGLYQATLHRVIHKGDRIRTSVPFFFEANFDAYVEPLDAALRIQEAEGDTDALKYKKQGIVYGDLLTKKVTGNFQV